MIAKRNIEALKALIARIARPLLTKHITRGVLWVMTAWFGMTAASAESAGGEIGFALAAIATAVINLLIDRWHHKADLADGRTHADQAPDVADDSAEGMPW